MNYFLQSVDWQDIGHFMKDLAKAAIGIWLLYCLLVGIDDVAGWQPLDNGGWEP